MAKPPADWPVSAISHGGSFDTVNHRVKWGPFLDATPRTLTYQLDPPPNAVGTYTFFGEAVLDSTRLTVAGAIGTTKFPGTLTRNQAASYLPGVAQPVTLDATPASDVQAWAVEERVPDGWIVSNLGADGAWDAHNRKVKWGPFFDATPRALDYTLTAPASERATAALAAFAQFDAAILTVQATLPPQPSSLIRTAPSVCLPNIGFTVVLTATPVPGIEVYALEETVPNGWIVTSLTDGGAVDPFSGHIKWGPFTDRNLRTLAYTVTPPPAATGTLALAGQGFFNRDPTDISGMSQLSQNSPPVAAPDVVTRRTGEPAKISVTRLLSNDTDADGDFLRILSIAPTSTLGGTLQMVWPWIYYTPPPVLTPPTVSPASSAILSAAPSPSASASSSATPPQGPPRTLSASRPYPMAIASSALPASPA